LLSAELHGAVAALGDRGEPQAKKTPLRAPRTTPRYQCRCRALVGRIQRRANRCVHRGARFLPSAPRARSWRTIWPRATEATLRPAFFVEALKLRGLSGEPQGGGLQPPPARAGEQLEESSSWCCGGLKDVDLASLLRTKQCPPPRCAEVPVSPSSPNLRLALLIGAILGSSAGWPRPFVLEPARKHRQRPGRSGEIGAGAQLSSASSPRCAIHKSISSSTATRRAPWPSACAPSAPISSSSAPSARCRSCWSPSSGPQEEDDRGHRPGPSPSPRAGSGCSWWTPTCAGARLQRAFSLPDGAG